MPSRASSSIPNAARDPRTSRLTPPSPPTRSACGAAAAIDLDDLVALAGPALQRDPSLQARWRARAAVLFVDEAQDLDRGQLDLALLLAGERRDIFLVGDDDQTIYAWRLADVRRVLGLAARLPGLRRVDLETNHRCAPEVVRRAARLVEHNRERFDKRILPSPRTTGEVRLLPDSGDEVARARFLLTTWAEEPPRERHAILARTNRELVPYAAVALELGIPYRAVEDGLLLDDERVERLLAACDPRLPPLRAIAEAATRGKVRTGAPRGPCSRGPPASRTSTGCARPSRNAARTVSACAGMTLC